MLGVVLVCLDLSLTWLKSALATLARARSAIATTTAAFMPRGAILCARALAWESFVQQRDGSARAQVFGRGVCCV